MLHHHIAHLISTLVAAAPTLVAGTRPHLAEAIRFGSRVIIAKSAAMREAVDLARLYAPTRLSVVIHGPTGTGKTLLAEYLHARSGRPGPLIRMTAAEISKNLVESELFGHVPGAFTDARHTRKGLIAAAGTGTLFVDDVQFLRHRVQAKLLPVLDSGLYRPVGSDVDVMAHCRLIFGLGTAPDVLVAKGKLKADFRYRTGECHIAMAPLAERREDVADLACSFLERSPERVGVVGPARLGPGVIAALEAAAWPGNVRELEETIHRAYVHARGGEELRLEHFLPRLEAAPRFVRHGAGTQNRLAVRKAVARRGGRRDLAAQDLGISRNTVAAYLRDAE